jgi:hypothetical protein
VGFTHSVPHSFSLSFSHSLCSHHLCAPGCFHTRKRHHKEMEERQCPSHHFHLHKMVKAYWKTCPAVTSFVLSKSGTGTAWDGTETRACSENAHYFQECTAACVPREGEKREFPNLCANQRIQRWAPECAFIHVHIDDAHSEGSSPSQLMYAKTKMKSNALLWPLLGVPEGTSEQTHDFNQWKLSMHQRDIEGFRIFWPEREAMYLRWAAQVLEISGQTSLPRWRVIHSCSPSAEIQVWRVRGKLIPALFTTTSIHRRELITVDFLPKVDNPADDPPTQSLCRCGWGCPRGLQAY